jgi:plasmid stabilization system protein ParE
MTSKPLRFHPQAEREYLTALAWYRERSLIAAINFESALEQAVERIRDAPERWPIYFNEFQRYILRQFPFSLVYEDFSSEIVVFAVAHGRRQPGYWMDLVVTGL